MEYTRQELAIFENVIRDYNILKKDIDDKIKKGYTINDLYDYIRHLSSCSPTNVELNGKFKYIDFNYCDMCISILEHDENGVYLGESLEIWNDEEEYYIGTFNNTRELEKILKEC